MTGHEFELLMGRLSNQDAALKSIDSKLDSLVLVVDDHSHYIAFARRVWKWGATIAATAVGAWVIKYLGWK